MRKMFVIMKNQSGNPKIPIRWGLMGNGEPGYSLTNGHIVCFESFEEADEVLETFEEPYWYDIIEFNEVESWAA